MAASSSRTTTSPGNHKVLLASAALLSIAVAACFLPGTSSAARTALVARTCGRTSNPRLCVSLLESSSYRNQSRRATTVHELAVVAVTAARRSVLRARMRASVLSDGTTPAAGRVAARCGTLYRDCLPVAAHALSRVKYMRRYDERVAGAVTALRVFPEKCRRLIFDARREGEGEVASNKPMEQVNRDTEDKLGIASEIVRLLRLHWD